MFSSFVQLLSNNLQDVINEQMQKTNDQFDDKLEVLRCDFAQEREQWKNTLCDSNADLKSELTASKVVIWV